ncbi:hypothetical protein NDU88_001129 [Pleurodeles waltl]|uniref:Uncharacterized protein n=1 Tax=Pleurodeles waltl TaxID=8319 RepID=A0AAV7U6P0_PLEWA|nr:hypothetical protein NDU88_001129 [Pleurodeles waltl]
MDLAANFLVLGPDIYLSPLRLVASFDHEILSAIISFDPDSGSLRATRFLFETFDGTVYSKFIEIQDLTAGCMHNICNVFFHVFCLVDQHFGAALCISQEELRCIVCSWPVDNLNLELLQLHYRLLKPQLEVLRFALEQVYQGFVVSYDSEILSVEVEVEIYAHPLDG